MAWELIDPEQEKALDDLFKRPEYADKVEEWQKFKDKYYKKHISYSALPEALQIAGIRGKQLYELVGQDIDFPNANMRELAECCLLMEDDLCKKICDTMYAISPDWWKNFVFDSPKPRLLWAAVIEHKVSNEQKKGGQFKDVFNVYRAYDKIPAKKFPTLSELTGVSLHWIFGLPNNIPFYTKSPIVDEILVAYGFLSDRLQEIMLEHVRNMGGN